MPLALQTRKRALKSKDLGYLLETWFWPFPSPDATYSRYGPGQVSWPGKLRGTQVTESENHPGWNSHVVGHFLGDFGGPFRMEKRFADYSGGHVSIRGKQTYDPPSSKVKYLSKYRGVLLPIDPNHSLVSFPSVSSSSDDLLSALGTKAIANVKPTNSIADLATTLAELYREGIPKMIGHALWRPKTKSALKKAGNEYLNTEFGWKPLVGDMLDVAKAAVLSDAALEQYEKDAGKVVRRRFQFPPEEWNSSQKILGPVQPYRPFGTSIDSNGKLPLGDVIQTDDFQRRRWFSGAFTYYLPKDYTSRRNLVGIAAKADALLGINPTPSTVWNLTPWSWAADWFFNTGDVINNLSDMANDGLVLRYGYMMEHTVHRRTYSYTGNTGMTGDPVVSDLNLVFEIKRRIKATPYGFGLTWEGFSSRQLAILSALGITRGRK